MLNIFKILYFGNYYLAVVVDCLKVIILIIYYVEGGIVF